MMQKIIIFLHDSTLSGISWVTTTESGAIQEMCLTSTLAEASQNALQKEIVVIAPPEDVLLVDVKMPKLSRQRLLQALPYALEEQLLTDVHELHFAIGDFHADLPLSVAIVNKQKITAWLTELKQVGLAPTALVPAPLALPYNENNWHIVIQGNIAIVRNGTAQGFFCDKENLLELIQLKLAEEITPPEAIHLSAVNEDFVLPNCGKIINKKLSEKQLLEYRSRDLTHTGINLLQGPYLAKRKATQSKKVWRKVSYLVVACLGLFLFSNIISFLILHHHANSLETAINTIYQNNFPSAKSIVAPKQRMTEKLSMLTDSNHKNRLLLWLAYIGKSITQNPTFKIQELDFRNNQLSIDFSAPAFDSVDTFTQQLTQSGLTVKPEHVARNGSQVKGTLHITEGG
jgi:general secretion pathway protein L